MFNMEDIYARLANGEKIEDIGNEIAAMMNEAMAKHEAAQAEKEAAKRDLIEEMVDIIKELAILEGMDPDDLQVSDEDMDQLVTAFTEMFGAMRELKKVFAELDTDKVKAHKAVINMKPSDDQILADFIKMFN